MKTLVSGLFILLFATSLAYSQDRIVKLGATDLLFNTLNVEYEQEITPNTSFQGELSLRIPTRVPGIVTNLFVEENTIRDIHVFSSKVNMVGIEGMYKIYTGKMPSGFFYAPYIKLNRYGFELEGDYDNQDGGYYDVPASVEGNLTTFSTGVQLGTQWKVGKNMTINWNFFGLGLGVISGNATYTSENTVEYNKWKLEVEDFLEELPGNFDQKITITSQPENKIMTADGTIVIPSVRMSLSVGYILQ